MLTQRRLQPGPFCTPNRSHPSFRGLLRMWNSNSSIGNFYYDCITGLVAQASDLAMLPACVQSSTYFADGFKWDGATGVNRFGWKDALPNENGAFNQVISVMALIVPGTANRNDIVTRWNTGTGGVGDQFNLLYGITSGKVRFYASTGAATANSGDSSVTMSVGTPYVIGGASYNTPAQLTTQECYVNGLLSASNTSGVAMNANPTQPYALIGNQHGDGQNAGGCALYWAAVWNRKLTPSEWWALGNNPTAPFKLYAPYKSNQYFVKASIISHPPNPLDALIFGGAM